MFYKGKKVLVTGGTGFIGAHIVQELLKQEAKIRIPLHKRPLPFKNKNIEILPADLSNPQDCLKVSEGIEYVFHAAGAVGFAGASKLDAMQKIILNLILTSRMLSAAWQAGVERFLLLSSSTVYPAYEYPVKENEAWSGPVHPFYMGYGWMKRYLERLAEYAASNSKLKIALLRPTAVYGPGDNFDPKTCHVIPALIHRAMVNEDPFVVWGSGNEVRDFIHVADVARASLLALERYATCDPVNIGCGKCITIREVVGIILKLCGHGKAKVNFDRTMPTAIPIRMVDTLKAKEVFGFKAEISTEEGLKNTIEWYKSHYGKK